MILATLTRIESGDQGTFGKLEIGDFNFYTLELPWRDNEPNISCIPCGVYTCIWNKSERFNRNMYLVCGVDNRSGIRIHPANLAGDKDMGFLSQLNGCIAIGEKIGYIDRQKALLVSMPAVRKLESMLAGRTFQLEVKND